MNCKFICDAIMESSIETSCMVSLFNITAHKKREEKRREEKRREKEAGRGGS
jgi:hypothetical protein